MRRYLIIPILLAVTSIFSGCVQIAMGRMEIDKLFVTRIITIDEAAKDKVKITLTTKSLSTGGDGQEAQQKSESIVSEGDTVYDAARNLIVYSDRKPHYGHTEYILFGESIARKGILPYLDFISRHNEFRYNAKIYIVKGDTANSMVKKTNTSKMFIGDRIASIEDNSWYTSLSSTVTLNEALQIFDKKNLDTIIPFIEIVNTMTSEEKQDVYDILMRGYGVFRKDRLFYFTSREEAKGLNWIMNRVNSGIIVIKSNAGEYVSMDITDAKVKLLPRIQNGKLYCTVDASFTTNIGEIAGTETTVDNKSINYLIDQQSKAVKDDIETALRKAIEDKSDRFGIITRFIMRYPMMKDYFNEHWTELYPEIVFEVKVKSNVKGTYMINEPTRTDREVKGE